MKQSYTPQAKKALQMARSTAEIRGHSYIGTEHLLVGLLEEGSGTAAAALYDNGVTIEKTTALIERLISPDHVSGVLLAPEYTPRAKAALERAEESAAHFGADRIGTEHILMALLQDADCVASRLLYTMEVSIQKLYGDILTAMGEDEAARKTEIRAMRGKTGAPAGTPALDQYSRDLTAMAAAGKLDPVIGREQEIARIIQILCRRTKNNPCLVGEPGVGKTAIVEGLAQRIVAGEVPERMKNRRVLTLDLSGMVAGSKYRGEFEERIKKVLQEILSDPSILLFIDEIHTIIGAGGAEGALDAANIIKPSLSRGELQLIGATTLEEYRKHIEKDAALERRFQPVTVEEPDAAQTIRILEGLRPYYEKHHGVRITDEALQAAVRMGVRYINDRYLPDKAIDLMDESSSRVMLSADRHPEASGKDLQEQIDALKQQKEEAIRTADFVLAGELHRKQAALESRQETEEKKHRKRANALPEVTAEDIAGTVSVWTGVPLAKIAESESRRLARLEQVLHKRIIGQEEAVSAVANAIRRGRVGLKDPGRPLGSFLFLGPTGVGKTELSKALAEAVFGSEDAMIRVDMSEYMEKHSVSKLIGSPPGYVGYDEGGQFSEKVRRHPYSVILFDEIEKAHPDVFNILLQVLDDGHITDAHGRKVSFKEAVIIMTSNAGANRIMQPKKLGFSSVDDEKHDYEVMKTQVMEEVRNVFRPEFLNRIDAITVFHALGKDDLKKIVRLLMADLIRRCKEQMDIDLRAGEAVREYLITAGYDAKYGARPIRRAIQSKVEDALSEEILLGHISRGDTVTVRVRKKKTAGQEPAPKTASGKEQAAAEASELFFVPAHPEKQKQQKP